MFSFTPMQRGRWILTAFLITVVIVLLISARSALVPFGVGLFLVYLLLPAVNFLDARMPKVLQERHISRSLSILLVYILMLLLLVGFFAIYVPMVRTQVVELGQLSGQYTVKLLALPKKFNQEFVDEWLNRYYAEVPPFVREAIDSNIQQITAFLANALQNIISWLGRALQDAFLGTLKVVTSTLSFVVGIVIVPFWVFYVLNDEQKLARGIYSAIPQRYRADVHNLQRIIGEVLGAYIRGQLLLCLFIGVMVTLGLLVMEVNFSILLGTIAGILEIVPSIGPFLGAIPAVLVALLKSPSQALQVAILFVVIQQIENTFLAPKVTGASVKLHPAAVMIVLLVGSEMAGIWGLVFAVPVTAVIRDVVRYLYLRLSDAEVEPDKAIAAVHPAQEAYSARAIILAWRDRLVALAGYLYDRLKPAALTLYHWGHAALHKVKSRREEPRKVAGGD